MEQGTKGEAKYSSKKMWNMEINKRRPVVVGFLVSFQKCPKFLRDSSCLLFFFGGFAVVSKADCPAPLGM